MSLRQLALEAAVAAKTVRSQLRLLSGEPVCPYDIASDLSVTVRLMALPSMEGVYAPWPRPTILLGAHRPAGRRRFTCAHELGHHLFRHGTCVEALISHSGSSWNPREYLASRFASALLLPRIGVENAFHRRGWSWTEPTATELFTVAQEFGVGYATLLNHMERTFEGLTVERARDLRNRTPQRVRSELLGVRDRGDVFPLDDHWTRTQLDMEIGDLLLVQDGTRCVGGCLDNLTAEPGHRLRATAVGESTLQLPAGRHVRVRVCRALFEGLARYRFLEDD